MNYKYAKQGSILYYEGKKKKPYFFKINNNNKVQLEQNFLLFFQGKLVFAFTINKESNK